MSIIIEMYHLLLFKFLTGHPETNNAHDLHDIDNVVIVSGIRKEPGQNKDMF